MFCADWGPPGLNKDSERAFAKNKKLAAKRHSLRSIENSPTGPIASIASMPTSVSAPSCL